MIPPVSIPLNSSAGPLTSRQDAWRAALDGAAFPHLLQLILPFADVAADAAAILRQLRLTRPAHTDADTTRLALEATSEAAVADGIVRIAGGLIGADQGALGLVRDGEVITVAALMPPRAIRHTISSGPARMRTALRLRSQVSSNRNCRSN